MKRPGWVRRVDRWGRAGWWLARLPLPRRYGRAVLVPVGLLSVGTVGYPMIEGDGWDLFDGFYMTAITLTTIGYGEIPHPLSRPGRLFTVALAYSGIFTLGYFATEIVRGVVTGELQASLGRQRMEDELGRLRDHVIVCGFGRMGRFACDELDREGRTFVVVDNRPPADDAPDYRHGLRLQGDATDDAVLKKAGVDRARALITAVGSDADNLYIALSARLLNPRLTVVARAEGPDAEAKLQKVGATKIVSPHRVGGHRAVEAVLRPNVLHFMETAIRPEIADLQLEEVTVGPAGRLAGRSLRDARLSQDFGVIVVGIVRPNGELLYSPPSDAVIEAGATLIALGRRKQLERLDKLAAGTAGGGASDTRGGA